jgi:V/A-type H+/Na+-transporting ATPase subunit D
MQLRVPPTRMALLRLKKRLAMARRGHRLLKDKLEGLVQAFLPEVEAYGRLRLEVDRRLPDTLRLFLLARAAGGEEAVAAALGECDTRLDVGMTWRSVMNIAIPELALRGFSIQNAYSMIATTHDFDRACAALREVMPLLLKLATAEEAVLRLATEIEKTRRRANALEYVLIPTMVATTREITAKLDEADRSNRARLMKIKDMLARAEES